MIGKVCVWTVKKKSDMRIFMGQRKEVGLAILFFPKTTIIEKTSII